MLQRATRRWGRWKSLLAFAFVVFSTLVSPKNFPNTECRSDQVSKCQLTLICLEHPTLLYLHGLRQEARKIELAYRNLLLGVHQMLQDRDGPFASDGLWRITVLRCHGVSRNARLENTCNLKLHNGWVTRPRFNPGHQCVLKNIFLPASLELKQWYTIMIT